MFFTTGIFEKFRLYPSIPIVFKAFVGSALAHATNSAKKPSKSKFKEGEGKKRLSPRLLLILLVLLRLRVPLLVPDRKFLLVSIMLGKKGIGRGVQLTGSSFLGINFLSPHINFSTSTGCPCPIQGSNTKFWSPTTRFHKLPFKRF